MNPNRIVCALFGLPPWLAVSPVRAQVDAGPPSAATWPDASTADAGPPAEGAATPRVSPGPSLPPSPRASETAPTTADAATSTEPAHVPSPPRRPKCGGCSGWIRQGLYMALSGGVGFETAWGSGPTWSASISGFGGHLGVAVGGSPVRGLAVGGTLQVSSASGAFHGGPRVTATESRYVDNVPVMTSTTISTASAGIVTLGVLVDWYPDPAGGWHAGGYAGLGSLALTDAAQQPLTSVSLSGGLFGGYAWLLGPAWSLGIQLDLHGATAATLKDDNDAPSGYAMRGVSIALEDILLYY